MNFWTLIFQKKMKKVVELILEEIGNKRKPIFLVPSSRLMGVCADIIEDFFMLYSNNFFPIVTRFFVPNSWHSREKIPKIQHFFVPISYILFHSTTHSQDKTLFFFSMEINEDIKKKIQFFFVSAFLFSSYCLASIWFYCCCRVLSYFGFKAKKVLFFFFWS